ncbi:cytochrome d ubiquinol oxidase subunit II [Phyllobacterium chamaecytisi]|uniref:cytochrome d ubiquinol oxidase subunit II n=1 Tax=Phyllobacterium chamaecytisi TaxID=2876082 RepID=UPI001CCF98AC|nr:cytochrome d ubiquinol oxidase subunit II [Phyllobacterium sp. KW56]MBZ9601396.1 cytochrome d ubiquinol oxidase subunit II [Phyllobacterium sp. KW56]
MVEFWTAALGLTLLLYILLDGFDLGVGILFGFVRDAKHKKQMLNSIAPVWDGNETWLILTASILFGAFPVVYALLLSAFYLPMILMLGALIFRGVAFEFREKSVTKKWLWDAGFTTGSIVATFVQGAAVGAMVVGIPNAAGRYSGTPLGWLTPFSILCGIGLCLGYALLGATWLVKKTEGDLRDAAYRQIVKLLIGVIAFVVIAFFFSLAMELPVMTRWIERPGLVVFPVLGVFGCFLIFRGCSNKFDALPFIGAVTLFISAFATLAASFYPYIIPFSITLNDAAAPRSSLSFLFWGAGIFVFPLTLIYTMVVYWLFKGKAVEEEGYD